MSTESLSVLLEAWADRAENVEDIALHDAASAELAIIERSARATHRILNADGHPDFSEWKLARGTWGAICAQTREVKS